MREPHDGSMAADESSKQLLLPVGNADSGVGSAPMPNARAAASTVGAGSGSAQAVAVRFQLFDTTTVISGGPGHPRHGPDTEPVLSLRTASAEPEIFKVFPCGPGQLERPAFNICREFKTCRELTPKQVEVMQSVLPRDTKAVVACARSAKGPAHLLALRVVSDAVVVETSRTDPDETSRLPHPLCASCSFVKLRPWEETRRVPLRAGSTVLVEPVVRTARTVGTTL